MKMLWQTDPVPEFTLPVQDNYYRFFRLFPTSPPSNTQEIACYAA